MLPQVPRLDRVCRLCATGRLGNEKHFVFECPELQYFRSSWPISFRAHKQCKHSSMQAFMWQDNKIGVANFINACCKRWTHVRVNHLISLVWLEEM